MKRRKTKSVTMIEESAHSLRTITLTSFRAQGGYKVHVLRLIMMKTLARDVVLIQSLRFPLGIAEVCAITYEVSVAPRRLISADAPVRWTKRTLAPILVPTNSLPLLPKRQIAGSVTARPALESRGSSLSRMSPLNVGGATLGGFRSSSNPVKRHA